MNINLTLLGQMITFMIFVLATMKLVWPSLMQAMQEREQRIADGLAAAERGQHELAQAEVVIADKMQDAKQQAADILEQARQRANREIDIAKTDARTESQRLVDQAQQKIAQEMTAAKQALRSSLSGIALAVAEKALQESVDTKIDEQLLDQLLKDLEA